MAEKPIDPRIDAALKKCNPQKAIYALAEVENEVIDQLTTTEGTLNTRMDGIETDMDNLEASVNTRITGIEEVANEANTKATNAVTTANQANATANQALTNSETTQTNLTTLEGVVDTAFNAVGNTESTSTVNVDLTTIGGQKKTTALPVASAGKAGVINTSDYIKFEGYDARIKSLEGQSITYLVQFPNTNPTQAEITATYRTQYPNAPFPPLDSTVLMDTTNELSYRWFENSQTWSKISAEPIGLFTLQKEGLIKGSDKVGEVYPNADGTGAVNGWDALGTRVTNAEAAITANTNLANSKGAQLNSSATATGVNVNLLNTAGTQISTTALPVASEAQAGIVNVEMVNKWNLASGLPYSGRFEQSAPGAYININFGDTFILSFGKSQIIYQRKTTSGTSIEQLKYTITLNTEASTAKPLFYSAIAYDNSTNQKSIASFNDLTSYRWMYSCEFEIVTVTLDQPILPPKKLKINALFPGGTSKFYIDWESTDNVTLNN